MVKKMKDKTNKSASEKKVNTSATKPKVLIKIKPVRPYENNLNDEDN